MGIQASVFSDLHLVFLSVPLPYFQHISIEFVTHLTHGDEFGFLIEDLSSYKRF